MNVTVRESQGAGGKSDFGLYNIWRFIYKIQNQYVKVTPRLKTLRKNKTSYEIQLTHILFASLHFIITVSSPLSS